MKINEKGFGVRTSKASMTNPTDAYSAMKTPINQTLKQIFGVQS